MDRTVPLTLLVLVGAVLALGVSAGWIDVDAGDARPPSVRMRAPLGDPAAAAAVQAVPLEARPANALATRTRPTRAQLARFRRLANDWGRCNPLKRRITGDYAGTTDEILQWAAAKWGLPPDVLRAAAIQETNWDASFVGDRGRSFGLLQIKRTASPGTFPLSRDSVAFNADYYAATLRYYLSGCATWLRRGYRTGDLWGAVGAWFSGRWYDARAQRYIRDVRDRLAERRWEQTGF